jgi:RNA polymerase sigma-70 factor (ECF subfamily)
MDIEQIIQEARKGDVAAFEKLFELKKEKVFWLSFRIVGDREDAREVSQLVFIRLWKMLAKYNPAYPFDSWLYRIVVNLSIDYYRRYTRKKRMDVQIEDVDTKVFSTRDKGPEKRHLVKELERVFLKLAAKLSPAQRTAFILKEIENLSTEDIAGIMECTESTVRNHLFQGRRVLQEELRNRYPEYLPREKREDV